jgi:TonB family protein
VRQRLSRPRPHAVAPDVPVSPALPEITFSSQHPDLPKPALEVKTNARPTFTASKHEEEAAPDVAATLNTEVPGQRLVALSEDPAPPPPELKVPAGNLTADFVKSPDANAPGAAGSATSGSESGANSKRASSARGPGIPGIAIVGATRGPTANIAGPPGAPGMSGSGSASSLPPPESHALGMSRRPGTPATPGESAHVPGPSIQERIKSALQPEDLLEPGRIYTIHVSMPNLSSVTGTWTLKFVELDENGKEIPGAMDSPSVAGPVPLRKVDPKYPPAFIHAKVQGDVILYAIIRRDGSVDSIQVVRSLDPQLDQNAMEALARWKFQAAQREGRSVELAAIVRIPFRATSAMF